MSEWRPDILGEEFECTDIDLGEDAEGPLCATLVRALPVPVEPPSFWQRIAARFGWGREASGRDPRTEFESCDVLYVHGWSDYFFQKQLARFFTSRGARFFALDLRKYGRSLREGQTLGYIEDLQSYDEEIDAAVAIIRGDGAGDAVGGADAPVGGADALEGGSDAFAGGPGRRLVLLGHSTGGLVLSLWASRHPGAADAIVLNSPWLELQISGMGRKALSPAIDLQARFNPHDSAVPQLDLGFYTQAQRQSSPDEIAELNLAWRPELTAVVRAAWLRAILAGQRTISGGVDVGAPVCVLLSARSEWGIRWNERMLRADTVLEVEEIARASLRLGASVTVERIDGALHDVFLSAPDVRGEAYARMHRWLLGWLNSAG